MPVNGGLRDAGSFADSVDGDLRGAAFDKKLSRRREDCRLGTLDAWTGHKSLRHVAILFLETLDSERYATVVYCQPRGRCERTQE
jgi:hypothetical protein